MPTPENTVLDKYGVSRAMFQYRKNITGVEYQLMRKNKRNA